MIERIINLLKNLLIIAIGTLLPIITYFLAFTFTYEGFEKIATDGNGYKYTQAFALTCSFTVFLIILLILTVKILKVYKELE